MVTVHKEHSGMIVMYFTCHYIDMKEEHSTPTAISDLSTWSVMVKVSASKWYFFLFFFSCNAHITWVRSVNIPWPGPGFGDADYIYAFQRIIMPIAYEFNPDLVISKSFFFFFSFFIDPSNSQNVTKKLIIFPTQFLLDSMLLTGICSVNAMSPLQRTDI